MVQPPSDCQIERNLVKEGQDVRKGDPLVEVLCPDLATAKREYELAALQWAHDKKVYDFKAPLAKSNTIPARDLLDAENAEAQSRLKRKLARDALLIFGLTEADIAHIGNEEGRDRARFTLRSPIDGKVTWVDATSGRAYHGGDCLVQVSGTATREGRKP